MKIFILYWLTGDTSIVQGKSITEAMNNAGYGFSAVMALDFYEETTKEESSKINYTWNKDKRRWIKN